MIPVPETFAAVCAVESNGSIPQNVDVSWTGQGSDKHRDD